MHRYSCCIVNFVNLIIREIDTYPRYLWWPSTTRLLLIYSIRKDGTEVEVGSNEGDRKVVVKSKRYPKREIGGLLPRY